MPIDVELHYRKYGPMVLRRCRQLLKDEAKARDAMHDVFVLLLRNGEKLEDRYPCSLLYTMATNICISRIRTETWRAEEPDDLLHQIASAEDLSNETESRSLLDFIFSREKPETRESTRAMAVMHLVDGMTLEEVGKAVGMSAIGVRKRLKGFKDRVKGLEGI